MWYLCVKMKTITWLGICILLCLVPSSFALNTFTDSEFNLTGINSVITIGPDCLWKVTELKYDATDGWLSVVNLTVENPDISEPQTFNFTEVGASYDCMTFPYPTATPSTSVSQCQEVKSAFAKFAIVLIPLIALVMGALLVLFIRNFDGSLSAVNLIYATVVAVGIAAMIIAVIMLLLASFC